MTPLDPREWLESIVRRQSVGSYTRFAQASLDELDAQADATERYEAMLERLEHYGRDASLEGLERACRTVEAIEQLMIDAEVIAGDEDAPADLASILRMFLPV